MNNDDDDDDDDDQVRLRVKIRKLFNSIMIKQLV